MKNITRYFLLLAIFLCVMGVFADTISGAKASVISAEKAWQAASELADGGTIERFKFRSKADEQKYFLTINTGNVIHMIDINASDGKVLKHEQKVLKEKDSHAMEMKISAATAQKAARKMVKTGQVVKCKFVSGKKGPRYNVIIVDGNDRYDMDIYYNIAKVKKYEHKNVIKKFIHLQPSMITPEQAQIVAKNQTQGIVIKSKLYHEKKHNVDAYKVDVIKDKIRYSYKIDALSGKVIETNINYIYNIDQA